MDSVKNILDLETSYDKKNLSILFLDNQVVISEKLIRKINENENVIFVCKDFTVFQKFSLEPGCHFLDKFQPS